jgi:hypothetical protein
MDGRDRDIRNRRWRRRVEQALTSLTAEIAALREQMEARADYNRRRSSLWAWLKWLVWVAIRQLLWDCAILVVAMLWLRLKGDRRPEYLIQRAWSAIRKRMPRLRLLRHAPRLAGLP